MKSKEFHKSYQGERKIADKNILIGEFIFDKVSVGGMPVIDISFKVDLNGIITFENTNQLINIVNNLTPNDCNCWYTKSLDIP